MSATIQRIAHRLGLSHTTVSRVLSGNKNVPIAAETRHRVLKTAQEMGYRPNLAARSMRGSRSNLVAIFASPETGIWSGNTPNLIRAVVPELQERDKDVFFAFTVDRRGDQPAALPPWRYDGALILQLPTADVLERVRATQCPCVAVNEKIADLPCILIDEQEGFKKAILHLHTLGHRRIAYANATQDYHFPHYSILERQTAYASLVAEYGLSLISGYDVRPVTGGRVELLRQALLVEKATAIVTYDHVVAMEAIAAIQQLQLRIPEDISLVSFNDVFPMQYLMPPVTVVDVCAEAMAREAAHTLLTLMEENTLPEPRLTRIETHLTVRGSTAPYPALSSRHLA